MAHAPERPLTWRGQVAAALVIGTVVAVLIVLDSRLAVLALVATAGSAAMLAVGPERVAMIAWAATAFTAPLSGLRVSASVALSDVFLVLAAALTLPSFATGLRRSAIPVHRGVYVGLGMIICGGAFGTLFAARPGASLAVMAKFVLSSIGSVAVISLWAPSRSQIRRFCSFWLAGAVFNAIWAITIGSSIGGRPTGLSTHPNHLAIVCMLGTGLALGMVLGPERLVRPLATGALPVLFVALLLAGSRAALMGYVVVVAVVALLSRRLLLALVALFVVGVAGVALLAGVVTIPGESGLGRLTGSSSAAGSNTERAELFARTVERFERHPFTGEGFEYATEAHNIYLQVAAAAGPLGLVGLLLVGGSVLQAGRRGVTVRSTPLHPDQALLAGLIGGYAGYLLTGLFQNILWDRYLWLFVAATLVLAATTGAESRRRSVGRPMAVTAVPGG